MMKLSVKILATSLFATAIFLVGARQASATTFGGQCPAVGANTDCEFLITINLDNSVTVSGPSGEGPYEPTDGDTLYGVQNNSANALLSFVLTGTGIFNFSTPSDGACATIGATCTGGDPTGYGGFVSANSSAVTASVGGDVVTFSLVDVNNGTVNFGDTGIASSGSAWFSLEGRAQLLSGGGLETTDLSTPEPGTLVLLGTGALALLRRRNRRSAK